MDQRQYQTELPHHDHSLPKGSDPNIIFASALQNISVLQDSHSKDSTVGDAEQMFRFERGRVEDLHLEPSPHSENDETCIQHIKEDILTQGRAARADWERLSTRLSVLGMVMLALTGAEIMGALTALLVLVGLQTPADQVMIWVGTMMLLCVGNLYMAVRTHKVARSTDLLALQDYCYCSLLFLSLFLVAFALILLCLTYGRMDYAQSLRPDQKSNLHLLRGLLVGSTALKWGLQLVCLYFCFILKARLTFLQSLPLPEAELP
jgi:hypothetical protein